MGNLSRVVAGITRHTAALKPALKCEHASDVGPADDCPLLEFRQCSGFAARCRSPAPASNASALFGSLLPNCIPRDGSTPIATAFRHFALRLLIRTNSRSCSHNEIALGKRRARGGSGAN